LRARTGPSGRRKAAAVVELAVLLPLLVLLFVIAVDFSRVFFFSLTLVNCARAGAIYASDPVVAHESPFSTMEEAALADATNLQPPPMISQTTGTDAVGRTYVEVSAAYTFSTVTGFPGIPHDLQLVRSVRMYRAAVSPKSN
jgi:Flp pilus assembly protein TadG